MIGMRDALTLAHTKIRSKRLRLLITTIVSGLVFGVMAGATILVDGMDSSLSGFARKNLDGRFLVQGTPNHWVGTTDFNPHDAALIAEVQKYHAAYLLERKAAAKRLGIEYDERSETLPYIEDNSPGVPAEYRRQVNFDSPAWKRYRKDHPPASTPKDVEAFRALVTPLGATRVFEPQSVGHLALTLLPDGTEDLMSTSSEQSSTVMETATAQGQFTIVDDELVAPFVVEPNAARQPAQGVPVLVSADDAVALFEKALDLPKRPKDKAAQIRWFTTVRDTVNGATFVSCHRNDAERSRVEQARSQAQEIAANRGNRDYVQPELLLAMPTTPCGQVSVTKDSRSATTKKLQDNQVVFEQEFNPTPAPLAELVTFQVVGLLPSPARSNSGIDSVLNELVGTNYGFGAVIPRAQWEGLPPEVRHESLLATPAPIHDDPWAGPMYEQMFIASFPSVERARTAVAENSCRSTWTPKCDSMPFTLETYGTNYLAVDDLTRAAKPAIVVIFAVAFTIATIIIWAMMGRVIADSRRETAVFRAIGAKRSDIMAVYLTYSLWVALRIVLFAALLGVAIAGTIHVLFADRATKTAQLAYAVFTPDPTFTFLGFTSPVLWWILGGIVAMSLVAITPPLLRNIRRNPIKDMRDE